VKHIAIVEKRNPTRKDSGSIKRNSDEGTSPKMTITASTIVELMRLFVAPHRISAVITSSIVIGVAMMASNIF
tara:strand:+ start:498 stop:716 length:219 start_codon:yes stop_codon:yes gene_type:complete